MVATVRSPSGGTGTVDHVDPVAGEDDGAGQWRDAREPDTSETTALLGPDAAGDHHGSGPRKHSWVGYADFEGLPWWKRPSVRLTVVDDRWTVIACDGAPLLVLSQVLADHVV